MLKKMLFAGLLILSTCYNASAQCDTPLTSINENFQAFQEDSFPQNCWTSSSLQTNVIDWHSDGNLSVFMLTGPGAQNASYLVSPLITLSAARTLTFQATGTGTLQVGTLTSATDFSTFVPLVTSNVYANTMQYHAIVPAAQTAQYIAFKVLPAPTTSHILIDNVVLPSTPGCEVEIASFDEDFSSFETGSASQHCWVGSIEESYMTVTGTTSKSILMVCETTENVNEIYLVSPRITSLAGNHILSFRASGADGQYQAGTLSSPYDFSTFTPAGSPVVITSELQNFNIPISAPETHHYAALKFTVMPGLENALGRLRRIALDNPLLTSDFENKALSVYPNPVNNILNISAASPVIQANIFDMSGRQVISTNTSAINVSQLNAGVYLLSVKDGNKTMNTRFIKE